MAEALQGHQSPASTDHARKLRAVCVATTSALRSVKRDCYELEEDLRRQIVASTENTSQIVAKLQESLALRTHIDELIASVERSRNQADEAVEAFQSFVPHVVVKPASVSVAQPELTNSGDDRVGQLLAGLESLHASGTLSDKEFALARERVRSSPKR